MTDTEPGNGKTPDMNDVLREAAGRNAFAPTESRDTTNDVMNNHIRRAAGRPVEEPAEDTEGETPDA